MSFRLHDIERKVLAVLLPLLLVMAPAMAQNVVYQGTTTILAVVQERNDTYDWELYSDGTVNFATVSGNCPPSKANFTGGHLGASVEVNWKETGTYFFRVIARDAIGCAMNLKVGMVTVINVEVEAIISGEILAGACEQVTLDGSKSTGNQLVYEWSVLDKGGELTLQSGQITEFLLSSSYKGTLPADFRVKLLVTDNIGKTDSDTLTIRIDQLPVAEIFSKGTLEKDGSMIVDGSVSTGAINYRWFTTDGKIVGADNLPTVYLSGVGNYSLEVTDKYGCPHVKSFAFPLKINQVIANPDYARTSWALDTTINVLNNDISDGKLIPGSVRVIQQPKRGETRINMNGSIVYIPKESRPGRDEFSYEVCDDLNTCDSALVTIDIYDSGVKTSEGFSPNGDGINDLLVFPGLENYLNSELYIYTRSGQLVYQNINYLNEWGGNTLKSTPANPILVPTGVYYYVLKLGGTKRSMKGFVYIGY